MNHALTARIALSLIAALALALVACAASGRNGDDDSNGNGPDAGHGGGTPDADLGPHGTVSGVVWMPSSAPGQVPVGQEIPVSEALVYVSTATSLDPVPQEVYCDQCADPPGYNTLTDAKGHFSLNAPVGHYWLAIQKGQFRIDQEIDVVASGDLALTDAQTALPSDHDPAHGKWLPHVAIAAGTFDNVETIFGKVGIGMVDASGGWVGSSAADNIDLYDNGGSSAMSGPFSALLTDLNKMKKYHLIVMPCTSTGEASTALFDNPTVRQNIVEYVKAGGKWYVADWAGEFEDVVWPEFIQFGPGYDTAAAGCTGGACNTADDFGLYDSAHSKAEDAKLNAWLQGQMAPSEAGGTVGVVDANHFDATDNWDHIMNLGSIQIGTNPEGLPIIETPHVFILGEHHGGEGPIHPLTVTFQPGGCGRVLYTTFHTTPGAHVGLIPQERVLLYLMGEIGVCHDGPIIP